MARDFCGYHRKIQALPGGFAPRTPPLPTTKEAVAQILKLIYGEQKAEWKTWEKRERNAKIYRRYLDGEDSVVLGRSFGLGDRRIRDIIEHERKRKGH
jgi:hypothetical protein